MGEDLQARILRDFSYHDPKPQTVHRYATVRTHALIMAQALLRNLPASRELSNALTRLEEVVFHANAAIARNPNAPVVDSSPAPEASVPQTQAPAASTEGTPNV